MSPEVAPFDVRRDATFW